MCSVVNKQRTLSQKYPGSVKKTIHDTFSHFVFVISFCPPRLHLSVRFGVTNLSCADLKMVLFLRPWFGPVTA